MTRLWKRIGGREIYRWNRNEKLDNIDFGLDNVRSDHYIGLPGLHLGFQDLVTNFKAEKEKFTIKTDEEGQVSVNETRLFLAIEVLSGSAGLGLFISGIVVYYCCVNRKQVDKTQSDWQYNNEI